MRDFKKHIKVEGGSARLAIENIVCHLDLMTDEQKAAINWHPEQSVSLAVMRLIDIDAFRQLSGRVAVAAVPDPQESR